jgi:predicted PurR-regulated permease PerM
MKDKEIELGKYQPQPPPPPGQWDQFTRQAAIVILLFGVLFLISSLRPLINLLGITGIFILILSYPVNKLRSKTKLAYPVAVFAVFIPLAIILFIIVGNVAGWFVDNSKDLVDSLQTLIESNQDSITALEEALGNTSGSVSFLSSALTYAGDQIAMALQFISLVGISFFLAFLFILEMPANLQKSFQSLSDVSQREFGILFDRLSNVWNGWLRSTVITSIIVGTTTALELALFGIPYAGILGVITGFLNLVPTFGPLISYILIFIVAYTQGSSYITWDPLTLALVVLIVNMLINQVTRLVIFPKLAGKAVHLPVFLVILGLVVAAALWGVIGVILVIPLLGSLREALNYVLRKINREDPYPGEEPQEGFWAQEIVSK